jgi:hypothetical protein
MNKLQLKQLLFKFKIKKKKKLWENLHKKIRFHFLYRKY